MCCAKALPAAPVQNCARLACDPAAARLPCAAVPPGRFTAATATREFADYAAWSNWASLDDLKACYGSGLKSGECALLPACLPPTLPLIPHPRRQCCCSGSPAPDRVCGASEQLLGHSLYACPPTRTGMRLLTVTPCRRQPCRPAQVREESLPRGVRACQLPARQQRPRHGALHVQLRPQGRLSCLLQEGQRCAAHHHKG